MDETQELLKSQQNFRKWPLTRTGPAPHDVESLIIIIIIVVTELQPDEAIM